MWLVWDKLPKQERNILIGKYDRAIYKNYIIHSVKSIQLDEAEHANSIARNKKTVEELNKVRLADTHVFFHPGNRIDNKFRAHGVKLISELENTWIRAKTNLISG